jgi:acetoin utilization protein AcuC
VVPRSWTHLLATVLDRDVDPHRPLPAGWIGHASRLTGRALPTDMSDGVEVTHEPWTEGGDRVDGAVLDTRVAVFPLHGLDPHDPRD